MLGNYDNQPRDADPLMKFFDLKIGQRFRYQGTELEKSGPLQATDPATGKLRSIMRSAAVELSSGDTVGGVTKEAADLDRLRQALVRYHQTCVSLLPQAQEAKWSKEMEVAYREILQIVDRLTEN